MTDDSLLAHHRFREVASRCGDRPAVVFEDRVVSYAEIDARSDELAARLAAAGSAPDRVTAVYVERSIDLVVGVLAVWKSGGAYLAVAPETPRERLRTLFDEVAPCAVVTQAWLRDRLGDFAGEVVVGGELPPSPPPVPQEPAVAPDNLAYVIHTSGTSGTPKGVAVSHRALVSAYLGWEKAYGLGGEACTHLQAAGFGFDVATGDLARALLSGGTLVLCRREVLLDPPALYALIRRTGVEFVDITPTMLRPLLDHLVESGQSLDFMRIIVVGGENWGTGDYQTLRRVAGGATRLINSYGVTEAAVDNTYTDIVGDSSDELPIGVPYSNSRALVLDAALRPAAEGELYLSGPQLARGYVGDPAATAQRFVPAPEPFGGRLYRTGDQVSRTATGELVYRGRADSQVKVGGVRVDLLEVETVLNRHPDVRSAVVTTTGSTGRQELAAYAVPEPGAPNLTPQELRRWVAGTLPAGMVPRLVTLVTEFPMTLNGKVDRAALLEPAAEPVPARSGPQPGSAEEELMARIWAEELRLHSVGPDQDFFELGGNSLLAVRVAARISRESGVALHSRALFEAPTLAELARVVRVERRDEGVRIPVSPARSRAPLAPVQNRLWILDRLHGDLASYNVPVVVRLTGALREDLLRSALDHLLDRHEVLRTAVLETPAEVFQEVRPTRSLPLERLDCTGDLARADRCTEEFVLRPFDLAEPPLLRAALVRVAEEEHRLVLSAHHIAFDGRSARIVLADIEELYAALVEGREPRLASTPVRYVDYAAWAAERLASGEFDSQLAYWMDLLADSPPAPELPVRGPGGTTPARQQRRLLGPALSQSVRSLAREKRTTLFVVLLAAYYSLLYRWTRQEDLIVGVPFGDRTAPGTDRLVGFFVDTVGLRVDLAGEPAFDEVLKRTRAMVAGSYANQDVPFEAVYQELGLSGSGERLFSAWFNLLGTSSPAPELDGLVTEVLTPPPVGALFDLNMYATELPDDLRIEIVYDGDRFEDGVVVAFLEQYSQLLHHVVRSPEVPLGRHSLVSEGALTVLPMEDAELSRSVPERSLTRAVGAWARHDPQRTAVRAPDVTLTYGELAQWAADIADRLSERGVGPGDVAAVCVERGAALVATLLGVLESGAAFCVLDPAYPRARLAAHVSAARPRVVLGVNGVDGPAAGFGLPVMDAARPADMGQGVLDGAGGELAYVALTSGTGGPPRAVLGDQAPVTHFLEWYAEHAELTEADRFATISGLSHDPLLRDIFAPLWVGAELCVPPQQLLRAPELLLDWLAGEQVSVAHLTPQLGRLLAAESTGPSLPRLRLAAFSGDQLRWDDVAQLVELAPGARVLNFYGTTETPQAMSSYEATSAPKRGRHVPVGTGIDGAQLLVWNRAGEPTGIGEPGRVLVRTPFLARGYTVDSDRFAPDSVPGHRRFDTGDLGRRLPDGSVEILGRDDGEVMIAGFRVTPADVDVAIRQQGSVRDSITVGRPTEAGETQLVSYVVWRNSPHREELRRKLRRQLPQHMLPGEIITMQRMPLTPNGKVDLAAFPGAVREEDEDESTPPLLPRTDAEALIASVWREVLPVSTIGIDSNFFDLGGSSMLMTKVRARLIRKLGQDVAMLAMFESPTVRKLAELLAATPEIQEADGQHGSTHPTTPRSWPDSARRRSVRRMVRQGAEQEQIFGRA